MGKMCWLGGDIVSFRGDYRFLSNFHMCKITFEGIEYPSVEHAYVAAKSLSSDIREYVSKLETPGEAKRYGREIDIRSDWDGVKLNIMRYLVGQKFEDKELLKKLLDTEGYNLIEGNQHGDRFWGECPVGVGQNHLGRILMSIRDTHLLFN